MPTSLKSKLFILLLLLTSLIGYLEWGGNNRAFVFEVEGQIFGQLFTNPLSVAHPFIVLPLIGQVLLIVALFQYPPNRRLIYVALGCIGLLWLFLFVIGILSLNAKMVFSTLPFIVLAILTIRHYEKNKHNN